MTSVFGSLFGATKADYAAVAPHSPEADATFVHTISYDCGGLESGAQEQWDARRHERGQPSRSSYVSGTHVVTRRALAA